MFKSEYWSLIDHQKRLSILNMQFACVRLFVCLSAYCLCSCARAVFMNSVFCILKLGVIQNYIHAARGYIYLFWFVSVYVCVCVCVSVFVCVCACVSCLLSLCVIESKVKRTWGRQGEWRAEGGGLPPSPRPQRHRQTPY